MNKQPPYMTPEDRLALKVPFFLDAAGFTVGLVKTSLNNLGRPTVEIFQREMEDEDGDVWRDWALKTGGKVLGGFKTSWQAHSALSRYVEEFHIEYGGFPSLADRIVPDMSHDVVDDEDDDDLFD